MPRMNWHSVVTGEQQVRARERLGYSANKYVQTNGDENVTAAML